MEKIKTGIIGCGKIAVTHANALKAVPESDFVAAFSRSREKAESFAAKYNIKGYSNLDEMLEKSGVQAVIICTPHPFHKDPAVKCMKSKVHVLTEKPISISLKDADEMIDESQKNKVKLGVVGQRRFFPASLRVKEAIESGKIGKPILASISMYNWRDEVYYKSDPWRGSWDKEGGGILVNQSTHHMDLFLWFMGEIEELYGYWANFNHPYIEVDDTAAVVLKFKNGGFGQITVSNSQKPGLYSKVMVHGDNGATVSVMIDSGSSFLPGKPDVKSAPPLNDIWTVKDEEKKLLKWHKMDRELFAGLKSPTEHFLRAQIKDFLNSIINDSTPMITGEDGRRVVELFNAIYLSNKEKKPIKFPL
jgi:UDP-N-acetyl-2-amino-2-deoxyglucuronate dehydrogenase